jgi:hypothetical protein
MLLIDQELCAGEQPVLVELVGNVSDHAGDRDSAATHHQAAAGGASCDKVTCSIGAAAIRTVATWCQRPGQLPMYL